MPLHLLGKKSWNVYNPANIARVKADEATAAAREAAEEQRMQEVDAARRAAILRGETPPPLPEEDAHEDERRERKHDRKKRRLAGEDETDWDIRLATSVTGPREEHDDEARLLKLRKPASDAPLTDHAGNINLFPVDVREAMKSEKNAEAEREKKKKEQAFEDQYTMRFSNAAGKGGLERPWYAATASNATETSDTSLLEYTGFESKNVWGNEDPRRRERQQARVASSDPFAMMQRAQAQLKKSKEDKKKWAQERDQELMALKASQHRDSKEEIFHRRRKRAEHRDDQAQHRTSKHRHRHRSRSRDRENRRHRHHEQERTHGGSESRPRRRSRSPERKRT